MTTNSERVTKARKALLERGGCKIPYGFLQPDASNALSMLLTSGYAASPVQVISRALVDAQTKKTNHND